MTNEVPTQADQPEKKEQLEVKEKMEAAELDKVVDRIKNLSLTNKNISIDAKGNVDALKFRTALNKIVADEKLETLVGVKNLANFLHYGLMERVTGKSPDKIGGSMGGNELTKWLKENKIAGFTIQDGNWEFFDKGGKPISAPYKLDTPVADGKKTGLKTEQKDKIGVSKGVDLAKKKAQEESAKKSQEATSEAERLKIENLEKAKSDKPVALKDLKSIDDLANKLESSVTKDGKAAIKKSEIQSALSEYIKAAGIKGENDQKKFENFLANLQKNYLAAGIEGGKIGFYRLRDGKFDSNPSGLNLIVDGKPVPTEIYVNEAVKKSQEAKAKDSEKKVKMDGELKPTKYDATELAVQKLLLGKEKPAEGEKMPEVNARYLNAYEAIMKFEKGTPVEFKLTLNDSPIDCSFYKALDGRYILTYGKGETQYAYFTPEKSSKSLLEDAKSFFVKFLNSGEMFQAIQSNNIKNKNNFENLNGEKGEPSKEVNQRVDDGPKILANNKVKYEFDWNKGWDPDVTIEALPHGELKVLIEKSGIGLNGENFYEFRASGFRDMMRHLKSIQKEVENPGSFDQKDLAMMNFFRSGRDSLQSYTKSGGADSYDAGKILNVRSVHSTVEAKSSQGVFVEFDWLSKLDPPKILQIAVENGVYDYIIRPGDFHLPVKQSPESGGFAQAMKALSEYKKQETEKGGGELAKQKANQLIEKYNKSLAKDKSDAYNEVELRSNVVIKAVLGDTVYLSMVEGLAPTGFDFATRDKSRKVLGIDRAVSEGYLIIGKPFEAAKKVDSAAKKSPEKPLDRISAGLDKDKENPAIVDRSEKETALANLLKGVKNAQVREILKAALLARMADLVSDKTDKNEKIKYYQDRARAFYIGDSGRTLEEKITDTNKVKPADYMVKASNELFGEKYLTELPNTRSVMVSLVYRIRDLVLQDQEFKSDTIKADQIKKLYADAIKDAVADLIKGNQFKKGESKVGYDKKIQELVFKKIKMPEKYLSEYKDNEAKKPAYAEYQKSAPPEQPKDKLSVKVEKEKTPIDFAEKKESIEKISAKVTDAITRTRVDAYLKARMLDMKTEPSGTELPKVYYERKAWELLRDFLELKGEYYDQKDGINKDLQKSILSKLNDKKIQSGLFDKVDSYSDKKDFLKDQPRTKAYLNGLMQNFDKQVNISDSEKLKSIRTAYLEGVTEIANEFIKTKPYPTKKGQLKTDYDYGMLKDISWKIKSPAEFAKEYQDNLDQKDKYKKYTETQEKAKKSVEDYETAKKNPHQMSFSEFEKAKMAGAAPEAWRIFKDTKSVRLDNVSLSRIEDNSAVSNPVSFNIIVGPKYEQIPFTITFTKKDGKLELGLAKGWNNVNFSKKQSVDLPEIGKPIPKSEDPLKNTLALYYGGETADKLEHWVEEGEKVDTKAGEKADQKTESKKNPDKPVEQKKDQVVIKPVEKKAA
jgi:hypothetical protein